MHLESAVILLFVIATAVALAARRLKIPYTVALVLAGLLVGSLDLIEPPHLTQQLLFGVFLPGLVFEAAFHLDFRILTGNRRSIMGLAIPGVVAAIGLTAAGLITAAAALGLADSLTWRHALVFGALIAATDPIAVVGLFRALGAPKRLAAIVEGESLLNDGTAIVFFGMILAFVGGAELTVGGAVVEFARVVGIGIAVGAALGAGASKLTQQVDDPMIEITLTTIAGYGAFALAEQFHGSGVIATVAAALLCGNYGARTGMSPSTRIAVESFWEYVAFGLNSLVFLLMGFEVHVADLLASWQVIVSAFLAVTLGRAVVVAAISALLRLTPERFPPAWSAVLTWGGLRGSLSMVLALSLPAEFPHRDLLITTTFGVVLVSLLLQGLTMGPLLRRLGLVTARTTQGAYEATRGRIKAASRALAEISAMEQGGGFDHDLLDRLRAEYRTRIGEDQAQLRDLHLAETEIRHEEELQARRHLLLVEKEQVVESVRQGLIGADASEHLGAEIDSRLLGLEDGH
ncbi:MAG: Na+/H+ antiporter [Gemmatimonadales bacterium]